MKIKINSMDTRANPSDDEIRSYMDFDKLIEKAGKKTVRIGMRKWWLALPPGLAALGVIIYLNSGDQEQPAASPDQTEVIEDVRTPSPVEMKPNDSQQPNTLKKDAKTLAGSPHGGAKESPVPADNDLRAVSPVNNVEEKAASRNPQGKSSAGSNLTAPDATDVYVQAEPRQGYTQLYAYFRENLKYPEEALRDSIEGIETVSFTIDEQGKPVRINVTHSLGIPFDEEARRLIQNMPDWKPATLNGRPVASQLSVPLTFQLRRTK